MSNTEEKEYIVKFFDAVSGWLHSQETVKVPDPADAQKAAIDQAKENTGVDLTAHRASVTDAATGHGIPALVTATNDDNLAAQQKEIDDLRKAIAELRSQEQPDAALLARGQPAAVRAERDGGHPACRREAVDP